MRFGGALYTIAEEISVIFNNLNCGVENGEFEVMSVYKCVHRCIIMQIRRVKDRVTTRRRKAVRNVKKITHNAETKSTKTLERVPTTDMEKLMVGVTRWEGRVRYSHW